MAASLAHQLRIAAMRAAGGSAVLLAQHGLTPSEWTVIERLLAAGAVPPSRLAADLGLTRGAVTRLIERLRAKNLVVQARGGADGRYRTVALTGAAARLAPELSAAVAAAEAALLQRLTPAARASFERALTAMAGDLS